MEKPKKNREKTEQKVRIFIFRYNKLVTTVLIFFVVVSGYYFVLQPKYEEVRLGGRFNLANLQEDLQKREGYLNQLQELNNTYDRIAHIDKVKLERVLPHENDIPGLLVQLEALALSEGILLSSVSFNEAPRVDSLARRRPAVVDEKSDEDTLMESINKININLDLVTTGIGEYEQVKSFLFAIEHNLRIFDINSVFFSPGSSNFSVSLETYYME